MTYKSFSSVTNCSAEPVTGEVEQKQTKYSCDRRLWVSQHVTMYDFFHFLHFIYHMYFYSQSHDWRPSLSHMTHLESYVTFSHDSSSYDSRWLRLTHSDSLMFHPLLFHLFLFHFGFMTHTRTSIVLVTYCSSDITVLCDVHCSHDAIVLVYYKVKPSK